MESNDEFRFRPITRGLGFHSNPNSETPDRNSESKNTSVGAPGAAFGSRTSSTSSGAQEADGKITASSVSRLISSLPTLDFSESDLVPDLKISQKPIQPATLLHTPLGHDATAKLRTKTGPQMQAQPNSAVAVIPPNAAQAQAKNQARAQVSAAVPSAGPVGGKLMADKIPGIPARDTRSSVSKAAIPKLPITPMSAPVSAALLAAPANAAAAASLIVAKIAWSLPKIKVSAHVPRRADAIVIDQTKYRETPVQLSAAIFDLLVVAGTTCIFAVALLMVTNTDLSLIVHNARTDWATRAGILLLFFSVHALYMVGSRSVAGCTLGEWAFDIQLGTPQQQSTAWYPLAICARYIVTVLTGYVALPIISMIMGRDVAANLCGVKLYQIVQ